MDMALDMELYYHLLQYTFSVGEIGFRVSRCSILHFSVHPLAIPIYTLLFV